MKTIEKQNWIELACVDNDASRKLALELAPSIADQIQMELILWLIAHRSFKMQMTIFDLLTDDSKDLLFSLYEEEIPANLKCSKVMELLANTDDETFQKVLLKSIVHSRESYPGLLWMVKEYKLTKKCGLKEAHIAVSSFTDQLKELKIWEKRSEG